MSGVQIVRLYDELPEAFSQLREEAVAEGYGLATQFEREWQSGFYAGLDAGHVAFGALAGGELAGVGALTPDPYDPAPDLLRIRHVYVRPEFRRAGTGRALATALVQEGLTQVPRLSLRAGDERAATFWETLGFVRDESGPERTHVLRR